LSIERRLSIKALTLLSGVRTALGIWSTYCGLTTALRSSSRSLVK
jgi:hypothetical protein